MKQTIKINLGGLIFHIDDDAFSKLQAYLNSISKHFGKLAEGQEIVEDIESRMAELFQPKVNEHKQSIILEDVEEVIGIMGNPEEFEEFSVQEENETKTTYSKAKNKKLYRDPENSYLGGVCGGLGAYMNIDPLIVRLIFFCLFFILGPFNFLLYILLWIVIPKAITTSQKLEMRGETITISNIEKSIKKEYENVKSNLKNIKNSKSYEKTKNVFNDILYTLGLIVKASLQIILIIIGVAFIIAGIAALTGIFGTIAFHHVVPFHFFEFPEIRFPHLYSLYLGISDSPLFLISLFLAITIPVVALIYGGIKLIFRFKANDKLVGVTALALWIVSILILFSLILFEEKNFSIKWKHSCRQNINTNLTLRNYEPMANI